MSDKGQDRLIGTIVTMITSGAMFLIYSYFGSFETQAASENKFQIINRKIDIIICHIKPELCLERIDK
jgi:hypothetical protein